MEKWQLSKGAFNFSVLFERLEKLRDDLVIEDYAIIENSLEHVFIQLCKSQQPQML